MTCDSTIERLPWLLNGTLPGTEQAEVVAHLRGCAACRAELAATGAAWEIFAAHLPAERLVDYALGLPAADLSRAEIETHLASCPECRAEVDRVRRAERAPVPTRRVRRTAVESSLRRLALAAALVAALGLGFVAGRDRQRPTPIANAVIVELSPAGRVERGAPSPAHAVIPAGAPATLLLSTLDVTPFEGHRLELRRSDGSLLWASDAVTRRPAGDFLLHLPPGAAPSGEWELRLLGRRGADWLPVESYRLRVAASR